MTGVTAPPPMSVARVNLGDPYHVYRWCRRWGVTESQLRAAVQAVGSEASAVEAAFHRARRATTILVREHRLGEDAASAVD